MSNVIAIDFNRITTAEMISAIMDSALHHRVYEGTFGSVGTAPLKEPGTFKVEVEDRGTFYCRRANSRWTVEHGGMVGEDADLELAARLILGNG